MAPTAIYTKGESSSSAPSAATAQCHLGAGTTVVRRKPVGPPPRSALTSSTPPLAQRNATGVGDSVEFAPAPPVSSPLRSSWLPVLAAPAVVASSCYNPGARRHPTPRTRCFCMARKPTVVPTSSPNGRKAWQECEGQPMRIKVLCRLNGRLPFAEECAYKKVRKKTWLGIFVPPKEQKFAEPVDSFERVGSGRPEVHRQSTSTATGSKRPDISLRL